ncbi:hypothetical protein CROQUDRAFT_134365 [Cronartium quercuum f. sp. fusiforme G11]|uniref:Uncharacterized protein n=1 Tax=Cronartium quercuum f. sp. fusiforme G11 TaxID=708437 RepID=A0A9P6NI37_9BASI|nr:hypothetical protein CROQUDRAFT_134365 [Cronartium quercuum f. sp. fusiforme G11]
MYLLEYDIVDLLRMYACARASDRTLSKVKTTSRNPPVRIPTPTVFYVREQRGELAAATTLITGDTHVKFGHATRLDGCIRSHALTGAYSLSSKLSWTVVTHRIGSRCEKVDPVHLYSCRCYEHEAHTAKSWFTENVNVALNGIKAETRVKDGCRSTKTRIHTLHTVMRVKVNPWMAFPVVWTDI